VSIQAAILRRSRLVERRANEAILAASIEVLLRGFDLEAKASREPETLGIVEQLYARVLAAYPRLPDLQGRRILDLACGSSTSKAPSGVSRLSPRGELRGGEARRGKTEIYSSLFEPWLCRILASLGALPLGIDIGDLSAESFEHHRLDLSEEGALNFLPSQSFDAVHDSRLFGSPEFTARFGSGIASRFGSGIASRFGSRARVLRIAGEIARQEDRLLRAGGVLIHSDAHELAAR
jgi:hypothetical protein